jgi:hypothetical protein
MCQNHFDTQKRPKNRPLVRFNIFILSRKDSLAEHICPQKPLQVLAKEILPQMLLIPPPEL